MIDPGPALCRRHPALGAAQRDTYFGDRDDPILDTTRKLVKRIDFVIERQELQRLKPGSNRDARAVQRVANRNVLPFFG